MKRFLLVASVLAILFAGVFCAFAFGVWQGRFQAALEENKLAVGNIDHLPNLDPQFREYLKARVYWNVRMFYPSSPGYLIQKDWDRGAVNQSVLADAAAAKDPTIPILDWQSAVQKGTQ
jgi:hypothetical protein